MFFAVQKNLLELLTEQKAELDSLREKGLQLEVATATSAGAAALACVLSKHHSLFFCVVVSSICCCCNSFDIFGENLVSIFFETFEILDRKFSAKI